VRLYLVDGRVRQTDGHAANIEDAARASTPRATPTAKQDPTVRYHLVDSDHQHHAWAAQASTPDAAVNSPDGSLPPLRVLVSFHYFEKAGLSRIFGAGIRDVLLDSGAFSAHTQGATISIDDYARFIRAWPQLTAYSNLDDIADPERSLQNLRALEARGLSPFPVFHVGEPWEYLERYAEEYDYVALGGMVPHLKHSKRLMPWLVRCFRIAQDRARPGTLAFHGFGATAWRVVSSFPWYPVDSSSWGAGFRYGLVPVFDPTAGRFHTVKLGDKASAAKVGRLLRSLGFDPREFSDRERNDRARLCQVASVSYRRAEAYLTARHGPVEIPNQSPAEGPAESTGGRIYLVDSSTTVKDVQAAAEYDRPS
jgi:hypothetical protein